MLADGLRQRAALLGLLLSDIYGEQRTFRSGALPLALVEANPRFSQPRPAQSVPVLDAYAADLLRGPDGAWRIVADHTGEGAGGDLPGYGSGRRASGPEAAALEAPAFAAVLPSLCRMLLGETLRLPSVPTLWFGDPGIMPKVASSYRRWAIRPAFDPGPAPVPLAALSVAQRIELHEAATAEPWNFAACLIQPASAALAPVLVRLFLEQDGTGWQLLPYWSTRSVPPGAQPGGTAADGSMYEHV